MKEADCNSSPIISLSLIGQLPLLWKLFDKIYITEEVYSEIVDDKLLRPGSKELKSAVEDNKISIYSIKNKELVAQLYGRLHKGELEVMVAAKELNIKGVIIDDRSARYFAESMMLRTVGLLGLLLLAKNNGLIQYIKPFLDLLIENDYRISLKLYNQILSIAKEI